MPIKQDTAPTAFEWTDQWKLWLSQLRDNVVNINFGVTSDVGDSAKTLTAGQDDYIQIWDTPLTADRAVTLSTTNVYTSAAFRVVRTANATGAFNLNVGSGPLKQLASGEWVDVYYDGSQWLVTAAGSL